MHLVGFSRQCTVGGAVRPYRYGGAVGPAGPGRPSRNACSPQPKALAAHSNSSGPSPSISCSDGLPYLLEVNPRPGATIDVFDDARGALFQAHAAAGSPPVRASRRRAADGARRRRSSMPGPPPWSSAAYPGPTGPPTARRPVRASPRYAPLRRWRGCHAGRRPNCRRRLDELAHMLYARARNTERTSMQKYWPGPERLRHSG